jgi:hypothetical protein
MQHKWYCFVLITLIILIPESKNLNSEVGGKTVKILKFVLLDKKDTKSTCDKIFCFLSSKHGLILVLFKIMIGAFGSPFGNLVFPNLLASPFVEFFGGLIDRLSDQK